MIRFATAPRRLIAGLVALAVIGHAGSALASCAGRSFEPRLLRILSDHPHRGPGSLDDLRDVIDRLEACPDDAREDGR